MTDFLSSSAVHSLLYDDATAAHARRIAAYRRYWQFYLGRHWSYGRDSGDPLLTINYSRRILDLHTNFTFKKGFKVTVSDDPSTPTSEAETRQFVIDALEETWRKNAKPLSAMEMGQQGGVTGDIFMRTSWCRDDELEGPYARADIIPSHLCFPEFGGPYGVGRKRLRRMIILNPMYADESTAPFSGKYFVRRTKTAGGSRQMVMEVEEWTAPVTDKNTGQMTTPAKVSYYRDSELVETKVNPLGEIPVVHIPNYPLSGEFYGISDMVDTIELNREINEKATDISDIINYHGSPTTILSGAKLKDMEKGANRVWSLPTGAKVENLALSGSLSAATDHLNSLKQALLELSGTPEQALGSIQQPSQTTAVALQIQYLPMMEKRNIKVLTYSLGLRNVNRLFLKLMAIGDSMFASKFDKLPGNRYRNDVVFPDPMPQDEAQQAELSSMLLDAGLSTRIRELEKKGVSQDEARKIIKEALEERKAEMELENSQFEGSLFSGDDRGSNPSRGGSDQTRGNKITNTIEKKTAL